MIYFKVQHFRKFNHSATFVLRINDVSNELLP